MKKLFIVGISLLSISMVKAQAPVNTSAGADGIFKPFKVDVAIGGAIPSGAGAKGGVLFAVEPKYAVIDQIAVGLRMEVALTARGFVADDGSSASANIKASGSYLATGDYYYTNKFFRPFSGAGAGIYTLAAAQVDAGNGTATEVASASSKFGFMLRSGFELGHFRLAAEYNFIGGTTIPVTDGNGTTVTTVKSKNSYLGLKAGFFFGGGRRK